MRQKIKVFQFVVIFSSLVLSVGVFIAKGIIIKRNLIHWEVSTASELSGLKVSQVIERYGRYGYKLESRKNSLRKIMAFPSYVDENCPEDCHYIIYVWERVIKWPRREQSIYVFVNKDTEKIEYCWMDFRLGFLRDRINLLNEGSK